MQFNSKPRACECTWPAAFCIALWLAAIAYGIGFIARYI
jgi:hypothetical protein